ncbi:MAG: hypothetical protein Q7N50_04475, partial [Armatimonadota bacterium]|nr:hypothetical protein [Armatimonadota bacterium]
EGTEYLVFTHDHVDHIIIDEFDGNLENGMEIAITAGNSGFILFDQNGKRRAQSLMGHAQGLCAGRYRPDLPGKQFLVGCLWGNTGTRSLFSGNGEKLWTIEPDVTGAYDKKLRWAAGRDVFLVNSSVSAAGLYDGYGRRIIPFPEASELSAIDRTFWAQDFTGNGLDDFVIQGEDALFIYTQGDAI